MQRLIPCGIALALSLSAAVYAGEAVPTLNIERKVWALDEDVFFWSGIHAVNDDLVPEDIEGCGVEVLDPDGARRWNPAIWPSDGPVGTGWSGGAGLSAAKTQEGIYEVRATCQGTTVEGSFAVRRMEILDDIDLRVEFEPECHGNPNDETVSIVVENRSGFPLLAAPPFGLMAHGVSFRIRHRETGAGFAGFVPQEVLGVQPRGPGSVMLENLQWDKLHYLEPDQIPPRNDVRRSFCLTQLAQSPGAEMAWPPGTVHVSASTQVLVGPRDGPWADAGPFRLSAEAERVLPPQLDLGPADP